MIHLRLVVPKELASRTLDLLRVTPSVFSVVHLAGAAEKPAGGLILADVVREDASVVLGALKELDLDKRGTIALEQIDSAVSGRRSRRRRLPAACPRTRSSGRR